MGTRPMLSSTVEKQLEQALRHLRYGTVQLVVHDAQVVRIERTERIRLPAAADAGQAGLTDTTEAATTHLGRPTDTPEARHATDTER